MGDEQEKLWVFDKKHLHSYLTLVKGWTDTALAKAMGVTRQTLWKLFQTQYNTNSRTLIKLMKVTGLSPNEIFRQVDASEYGNYVNEKEGDE